MYIKKRMTSSVRRCFSRVLFSAIPNTLTEGTFHYISNSIFVENQPVGPTENDLSNTHTEKFILESSPIILHLAT